jgi:4'-phosphopantetheinyl transferase
MVTPAPRQAAPRRYEPAPRNTFVEFVAGEIEPTLTAPQTTWERPPAVLAGDANAVHLWRVSFTPSPVVGRDDANVLDHAERRAAARFRFDEDRQRYTASHVALRRILARYLGAAASAVAFAKDPNGKPCLADDRAEPDVRFNLSHCRSLALIAVAWRREVGVDVEAITPDAADLRLAARRFAPGRSRCCGTAGRRAARGVLPHLDAQGGVPRAGGQGLSILLDSVDTTSDIEPSDSETAHKSSRWSLHSFEVGHDCAAAVSIQGAAAHIRGFDWR